MVSDSLPTDSASYLHSRISQLVQQVPTVEPEQACVDVFSRLLRHRELDFIVVVDRDGAPLGLISRVQAIEQLGHPFFRELHRKTPIRQFARRAFLAQQEDYIDQVTERLTTDDAMDGSDAIVVVHDGRLVGIVTFTELLREVYERKQAHLYHLAHFDALTRLPNRMSFQSRLTQACAEAARRKTKVGLILLDLDGFKVINDSIGHDAGDQVLRAMAERLPACLRETDTLARLGGDEFTVILPDIQRREAVAAIAERLVQAIREPVVYKADSLRVTGSLGIAFYPNDGTTPEVLTKKADLAMYEAKDHGKNGYRFFSKKLNKQMQRRLKIEQALQTATTDDSFSLRLQPIVDLGSGKPCGLEALLRWQLPDGEPVSPAEFLAIAEEGRTIFAISDWVLQAAARLQAELPERDGPPLRLALNLSALDFQDRELLPRVQHAIDHHGLQPETITLELTEQVLSRNIERVRQAMQALSGLGFTIALDDFGTGFSSLAYLRDLPIDLVKIDRTFVQQSSDCKQTRKLVRAMVSMARSLELQVCAEGVETAEQLKFVRAAGMDFYQGYLCSEPLDPSRLKELLARCKH